MKFQDWRITKKSLKETRIMDRKAIQKLFCRVVKCIFRFIKERFSLFLVGAIIWFVLVFSTIYNPPIDIFILSYIYRLDIPGTIMSDPRIEPRLVRALGLYLLGVGVAPLALWLTNSRTQSLRKQTEALQMQTKTDAFAKSIELLGNKRAAVRQGGIYALGKIAKDNPEDHMTVIRIITSYIRKGSHDIFCNKEDKFKPNPKLNTSPREQLIEKLSEFPMDADIEAAIEVIRERNKDFDQEKEEYGDDKSPLGFDISNAYLFNADFSNVKLSRTNFSNSVMSDCVFDNANLSKSLFGYSDLREASFKNCNLTGADFIGTEFRNCDLTGADLTKAKNLKQEQINQAKIDETTKLSEGIQHP